MHPSFLSSVLGALAVVTSGAAVAQGVPPASSGGPAAAMATASAPASKAAQRKRVRRLHKPVPAVMPGVTGGTPETSARTPGGPPLDVPNGLTVPIPSLKK